MCVQNPPRRVFELPYKPPYDWDHVCAFLAARATAGVESVDQDSYRRTIAIDGRHGAIAVSRHATTPALMLDVTFPDSDAMPLIVERVRRMFDLDADPAVIAQHLGSHRLLGEVMRSHPGIRTPGAWDAFELTVRAVLGQQVSVRAATTIAGRVVALFGSATTNDVHLSRVFPTPMQLADAPLERAGVMPARANTIRTLARRVTDGSIVLTAAGDADRAIAALTTVPGIGEWTAQYVAMRAFGDADAFLSADLILRRAAGGCTARDLERLADAWRPWRAYAVMLLWSRCSPSAQPLAASRIASPARRQRMRRRHLKGK